MDQRSRQSPAGFSLVEVVIAIAIIAVLLSILVPSLNSARTSSQREVCVHNQTQLGTAWAAYLDDNNRQFPVLLNQPSWRWGGASFNAVDDKARLDFNRPLSAYASAPSSDRSAVSVFECPADRGIESGLSESGTGDRTAFRSFGTSYRANSFLMEGHVDDSGARRNITRDALLAAPASMVLIGDAGWYEQRLQTGRTAHWHGDDGLCNVLFLDGSVRSRHFGPDAEPSAVVFECALLDTQPAEDSVLTDDEAVHAPQ